MQLRQGLEQRIYQNNIQLELPWFLIGRGIEAMRAVTPPLGSASYRNLIPRPSAAIPRKWTKSSWHAPSDIRCTYPAPSLVAQGEYSRGTDCTGVHQPRVQMKRSGMLLLDLASSVAALLYTGATKSTCRGVDRGQVAGAAGTKPCSVGWGLGWASSSGDLLLIKLAWTTSCHGSPIPGSEFRLMVLPPIPHSAHH